MLISYKWIQEFLRDKLPEPAKLDQILNTRAFEVEGIEGKGNGEAIIDIDVLPNRAHDCLCHYGIAKEISVLTDNPLIYTDPALPIADFETNIKITIDDENCLRYVGCEIQNVKVVESPNELRRKLEAIGQRSINTIVDITNIVMFELGQPMHAFERNKISGDSINIRKAKDDEKITLLDGSEVKLKNEYLLIADAESPLAIAGIKGGNKAEVDSNTTSIVLESANFNSGATRKTGQKLGIKTESSKRFEHEITPELAITAMHRTIELIKKYASTPETKAGNVIDIYPEKAEQVNVVISVHQVNRLLGTNLTSVDIENIFNKLKFEFDKTSEESDQRFTVKIPAERLDLRIKEDLIEEIGRIYGYENIQEQPIDSVEQNPKINKEYYYTNLIRVELVKLGFSEVMTQTFTAEGSIRVLKPLADDKAYLRTSLLPELSKVSEFNFKNADLLGLEQIQIFEIGKVFEGNSEKLMLGLSVLNKRKELKPSAVIDDALNQLNGRGIKISERCQSDETNIEIDLGTVINSLPEPQDSYPDFPEIQNERFKPFSPYPFVLRDIAVWIPDSHGGKDELMNLIIKESGDLLIHSKLVDVYPKADEQKTSYAFRLVFQSFEKTLTDDEINKIMEKVTAEISKVGWEVR